MTGKPNKLGDNPKGPDPKGPTANENDSGAPFDPKIRWEDINWPAVELEVSRLQARIVKAEKEGRHNKVKVLQRMLTHSFSGRALAAKRVAENKGKKTPGVDKKLWDSTKEKMEAVDSLRLRGYKPLPLRRINIPKANGKTRPLGIPTMKDRAMQALYLLALDPIAECRADSNSFGFRVARSCADALEHTHLRLATRHAPEWILEADIEGCFDHISHQWLMQHVPTERALLHGWLKAGYIENRALFPTDEGTPQGGIISPVLANFALDGLQEKLLTAFPKRPVPRKLEPPSKVNLIRYADDFVITGSSKELLESQVVPLVQEFLAERGLKLSPQKTRITHIKDGFDFLGQNIRRYDHGTRRYPHGIVLNQPAKKNIKAFKAGIRQVLKSMRAATAYHLVAVLNPKIRGWANYHRHAASKQTFSDIDRFLFRALWRWAKRRHPNKSSHWVADKYFGGRGLKNWRFFGDSKKDALGQTERLWLLQAAATPIQRYVAIQLDANPYDPTWQDYFVQRKLRKVIATAGSPLFPATA